MDAAKITSNKAHTCVAHAAVIIIINNLIDLCSKVVLTLKRRKKRIDFCINKIYQKNRETSHSAVAAAAAVDVFSKVGDDDDTELVATAGAYFYIYILALQSG